MIIFDLKIKKGLTETRTRIEGIKIPSDNLYTIKPTGSDLIIINMLQLVRL